MGDETFLYHRIAGQIRREILEGRLKPGDRLPSIREQTSIWHCTQGTIQRAYQELAALGLLVSQAGKGTRVAGRIDPQLMQAQGPLRRASLVQKADAFLLEAITAGFDLNEVSQAVDLALDRWRSLEFEIEAPAERVLRFSGSHDSAVSWLAGNMREVTPGVELQVTFSGSLGGLMALAEGRADLAGCHLWDPETRTYNLPFIRKLFPGRKMAAIRLADRRLGWITQAGNPLAISALEDIARPELRYVNRQPGSGTRVWLDASLERLGLDPQKINGYEDEKHTHAEVARAVAEGQADFGLGLEAAAAAFQLDFIFLVKESYDLVLPASALERQPFKTILNWLAGDQARRRLGGLIGYDTHLTGSVQWV